MAGTGTAISFGNQTAVGTYSVVASNTNGSCNLTLDMNGSVNVSNLARPTATTCYTADLCQTGAAAITVNVSGTLANYTVTCAGVYNARHPNASGAVTVSGTPATINTNTGNTTFSGLPGNATYTITVTDANGCTAQ